MSENFRRMIELAETVFDARNDPQQLEVTESVIAQLKNLHPATISDFVSGDGPVCWILLIPSTLQTMEDFLKGDITEAELLQASLNENDFDALYLCSALVLPEFRKKGIAYRLTHEAILSIQSTCKIKFLYAWPFSEEGKRLSEKLCKNFNLSLRIRTK